MQSPLSPLAQDIISAGSYTALVAPSNTPDPASKLLASITPDQLLSAPVRSYPHAFAMLSGLWLWHDALHECHEIAQKSPEDLHASARNPHGKGSKMAQNVRPMETMQNDKSLNPQRLQDAIASLSFWHAIMHRREGDFWNSKYWYARCRNHPALAEIAMHAKPLLATLTDKPLAGRLGRGGWDTDAFVDWVEEVSAGSDPSNRELAVKLQRVEWQALFEHCAREAAGR